MRVRENEFLFASLQSDPQFPAGKLKSGTAVCQENTSTFKTI